jgi:hypothetical protein
LDALKIRSNILTPKRFSLISTIILKHI